jgi:hypothetical protein
MMMIDVMRVMMIDVMMMMMSRYGITMVLR